MLRFPGLIAGLSFLALSPTLKAQLNTLYTFRCNARELRAHNGWHVARIRCVQ